MEIKNFIFEIKSVNFSSQPDSDYFNVLLFFLFVCRTKKLFEFPVERDFPKENAFNDAQYPFIFQTFFRIRFFDTEVRFFGTAIEIKIKRLLIGIAGCERHLLFKINIRFPNSL